MKASGFEPNIALMAKMAQTRTAQQDDLDRVAQVWHASASASGVDDAPPDKPSVDALRTRIDIELADAWTLSVACIDGEIVGMLAVKKAERVLDQLFIMPGFQRQGVGKLLLNRAMEEMPAGFTLRTASGNISARTFYERMDLRLLTEGNHPRHGYPVCYYGWNVG